MNWTISSFFFMHSSLKSMSVFLLLSLMLISDFIEVTWRPIDSCGQPFKTIINLLRSRNRWVWNNQNSPACKWPSVNSEKNSHKNGIEPQIQKYTHGPCKMNPLWSREEVCFSPWCRTSFQKETASSNLFKMPQLALSLPVGSATSEKYSPCDGENLEPSGDDDARGTVSITSKFFA